MNGPLIFSSQPTDRSVVDLFGQLLSYHMCRPIAARRKLWIAKKYAHRRFNKVRTAYGPKLVNAGNDRTFLRTISGSYGPFIPDILAAKPEPFTFIDIGANTGIFSLVAAALDNCRQTFAFEPNPDVFERLQKNIALNRADVEAFSLAITGNEDGEAGFSVPQDHSGCGTLEVSPDHDHQMIVTTAGSRFLSELAARIDYPVVLKIDVEGHEEPVLTALFASDLAEKVSDIIIECAEEHHPEGLDQMFASLNAAGFQFAARSDSATYYDSHFVRQPGPPA